ncbi:MAG: DMT family transporter [Thermodesulfobacteriota bacterium]
MVLNVTVLMFVAAFWAFTFIFLKIEERTITPITIMFGRSIIAFVFLFIVALILRKDLLAHVKDAWKFFTFALLGISALWISLAFGQEHVSAGVASVIVTTTPLLTFVILVLILKEEHFSFQGLLGLLIGVAGIVLVIGISKIMGGGSTLKGVLLIFGGFVCFTINGILVAKLAKTIDPVITSTWFLFFASIILGALAFIFESPMSLPWTGETIAAELALGLICTGLGYFGYYFIIYREGAYFSSFIFYFIPVFGLLAGHLVLNEKVVLSQIIGVIMIVGGVYLVNRAKLKGG